MIAQAEIQRTAAALGVSPDIRDEVVVFPIVLLGINHSYSDSGQLPKASLRAYALEEVFTEKLRALAGQRKYAVSRDLYDLWSLNKSELRRDLVLSAFHEKCKIKGLNSKRSTRRTGRTTWNIFYPRISSAHFPRLGISPSTCSEKYSRHDIPPPTERTTG
ncbi:MAG: nucleotidyl transferase AbiEii/AbiGii toxin family protein [Bacteroidota bacterium]